MAVETMSTQPGNMQQTRESHVCLQSSALLSPWAWPDILGAYRPWTRAAAMVHVSIAAMLAVAVWDAKRFTRLYWQCFYFSTSYYRPADRFYLTSRMVFFVAVLNLLPFLYLWAVRYCTVRFAGRCEISALQKDMRMLSEAASFLRQLLLKLSPVQNAAHSSHASNDHPSPASSGATATELAAAFDSAAPNHAPDDQSEPQDTCPASPSRILEICSSNPEKPQSSSLVNSAQKHSDSHAAEQTQNLHQLKACQESTITEVDAATANTTQASSSIADLTDDNICALSPALKLRAGKALEASTTMLANLSVRLQAYVYLRTDTHVQGNAACQAALDL